MSDDLHAQLLAAFREEYREHLEGLRLALATEPIGTANLEEAFRRAHSLKAAARVCDLGLLAALAQRLEMLFSRVRQGALPMNAALLSVARQTADAIESWARAWEEGQALPENTAALETVDLLLANSVASEPAGSSRRSGGDEPRRSPEAPPGGLLGEPSGLSRRSGGDEPRRSPEAPNVEGLDAELLAAFQVEHREHLEGIRALLAQIEASGGAAGQVDEAFRRAHSLKGAARIAGLRPAELVAHRLETLFAQAREGTLQLTPDMLQAIQRGLNFIEDAAVCLLEGRPTPDPARELSAIDAALGVRSSEFGVRSEAQRLEGEGLPGGSLSSTPHSALRTPHSAEEAVRVSADHLDRLLQTVEQVLTEGLTQDRSLRELALLQREAEELLRAWDSAGSALRPQTDTPEKDRVSSLLNHIGAQVRGLARQARVTHRLHRQSSWTLRVLGKQLQHDVRLARTVPAESVFQGYRKMMRDLAQTESKEIDFRVTGLEVKADRLVLQALKDPLMHVLRNAVCHGIEAPAERRKHGKEPTGRVSLHLEVVGSRLHILVEDDGRGIDPRKLAEEAVRRRVLTEAEVAAADPEELTRLVFRPGFTTSRVVTELSGRGMGLSVVQEGVSRLLGEVTLSNQSQPDSAGTVVRIVVPLSVSAQRLLLVASGGQKLAIPVHGVEQLCRIAPREISTMAGQPVLLRGGEAVPLRYLAELLGLDGAVPEVRAFLPVVVVRSGPRRMAVVVESLLGERDVLIKDLGSPAGRGDRWAGGILLEDGSVCLVLNPVSLFRAAPPPQDGTRARAHDGPSSLPPSQKTILVVDDSLTTRTLEKSILEAHGYRVRIALDGMEALAQLRTELPDLVITDLQMPRLDGFGLLEQMKQDPRLARIPVIVVTSLERREDQERGLALGADAYIVKRKFDHEDLLQTVGQIL